MSLRRIFLGSALLAASLVSTFPAAQAADLDIKRLAPTDAYTIVYAKKNPEREYQAQYFAEAWQTFRDERIAERVWDIIVSRAPEEKLNKLKDAWAEMETALEPIDWQAAADSEEFVMASVMIGPVGHTLVAMRLSDEDAADYREGVGNLFEVFQKWSEEKVIVETKESDGAQVTTLNIAEAPKEFPFHFVTASTGDLFLISTSAELVERCLGQLNDESAKSKFDDERLVAALKELPEPEDVLTFFDAEQMFEDMRGLGDFIREHHDEEHAARGAKLLETIIDEVAIIDYEVNVEYTEEGQNRFAALGQVSEGVEDTILGKALSQGEPFDDWQSWVPEDATAYSLGTGINLHELYVGVLEFVRDEVPESHEALDKWQAVQDKVGVNLDEDILKPFHGEYVSVTLADGQSVTALKCTNEEKIRELLDRAIEGLKGIPQVAAQGVDLVDLDEDGLDGFQEIKANPLAMTGARPVLGFRDGWMIMASSPATAKKLLAVRAGDGESIKGAESLKRFDLKTDGPVEAVSYSDIGAGVRAASEGITQAAMMAPMVMAAATADASEEDKKTINEVLGLLPSIAKVIAKFDFYEQKLSITREGPEEGQYLRESVTLIRQPSK